MTPGRDPWAPADSAPPARTEPFEVTMTGEGMFVLDRRWSVRERRETFVGDPVVIGGLAVATVVCGAFCFGTESGVWSTAFLLCGLVTVLAWAGNYETTDRIVEMSEQRYLFVSHGVGFVDGTLMDVAVVSGGLQLGEEVVPWRTDGQLLKALLDVPDHYGRWSLRPDLDGATLEHAWKGDVGRVSRLGLRLDGDIIRWETLKRFEVVRGAVLIHSGRSTLHRVEASSMADQASLIRLLRTLRDGMDRPGSEADIPSALRRMLT